MKYLKIHTLTNNWQLRKVSQSYGKSSIQGYKTLAILSPINKKNYIIMDFQFTGVCRITVTPFEGKTKLRMAEMFLHTGTGLDARKYENPATGELTREGAQVLASTFIQGLAGVVKAGLKFGYFTQDDIKNLLLKELERSVDAPTTCTVKNFEP